MNLIADIFITVKDRYDLAAMSIDSLMKSLPNRESFRLTLHFDGEFFKFRSDGEKFVEEQPAVDPRMGPAGKQVAVNELQGLSANADYIIQSKDSEGLGPAINRCVAHIKSINDWYSDPIAGRPENVSKFLVYCQDDCLYERGWLEKLIRVREIYGAKYKVGFVSGHNSVEHKHKTLHVLPKFPWLEEAPEIRQWIRMTNVLGERQYWESLMPIPRFDIETGGARAKPDNGVGSGCDWHIIRNHPNSICNSGRTCLVVPGLVQHIGFDRSTWLNRQLPESLEDARRMAAKGMLTIT